MKVREAVGEDQLILVANQVWKTTDANAVKAWDRITDGHRKITVLNLAQIEGVKPARGVPHAFILKADGSLVFEGHPADKKFVETLQAALDELEKSTAKPDAPAAP